LIECDFTKLTNVLSSKNRPSIITSTYLAICYNSATDDEVVLDIFDSKGLLGLNMLWTLPAIRKIK
jgi:hypothetical protein